MLFCARKTIRPYRSLFFLVPGAMGEIPGLGGGLAGAVLE